MPTLRVLCTKEQFDSERLRHQIVIVLDILFATSTIVHAFSEGVESVWPALDSHEADYMSASMAGCIRAGEYLTEPLPGFASAAPLTLAREPLRGKSLVYCTTNGTVAIRRAEGAAFVYVGALLNGAALVAHVIRAHPDSPVLIVCAGSLGHFSLEDFYGASHIVSHFEGSSHYESNDVATAAMLLYRGCDARTALRSSRVGKIMQKRSLQYEVDYAASIDTLNVVARFHGGRLKLINDCSPHENLMAERPRPINREVQ
jgi:2-phosphosulfolactate phosphatase